MTCPAKPSAPMSLVAGLLALSSSAASAEPAASSRLIKCEGPFGRNAGHSDLVKAFGNKNVVEQEIDGAEGQKIKASVLYPDDPKARLEFVWSDEKARRASDADQGDGSIGLGHDQRHSHRDGARRDRADERQAVQALRLRLGLRRQGHGLAGRHAEQAAAGGCILGVDFVHPEDSPEANLAKVTGDGEFLSDNADMRAVEPFVGTVNISYPKR